MESVLLGKTADTKKFLFLNGIGRGSGLYVLGIPGMGKSSLIVNIALHDTEEGHSLFFLDPHADAISDYLKRGYYGQLSRSAKLLDPEDETHSFGINLLSCRNVNSLRERMNTYTRAYNVFYKLWEREWGPWLQLILQNTLHAFIENQEYTLAEVPMFLDPYNSDFRNHIVDNMKHNSEAAFFWKQGFFRRRERAQQEMVDAALTRVTTLLTHPYVRDIIGQHKTTIDFDEVLKPYTQDVLLLRLSANLSPDIKKFIGTILISELLHAVRRRPENERDEFCVFIDEFQNFTSSDDFTTLITEGRKFGVVTTIAHQERFGQFEENQKLMGATLATGNKILFQLSVKDAQELAPEFADKADDTKARMGGELILSPRPIEDVWERGHPFEDMMHIRNRYFWIADLLRRSPQEKVFFFDPSSLGKRIPEADNAGQLHWDYFDDWQFYGATADMFKKGVSLLNQYYYDWMQRKYAENAMFNDKQINLLFQVIECLGGLFGLRASLEPYISDPMRHILFGALRSYRPRAYVYEQYGYTDKHYPYKSHTAERFNEYKFKDILNSPGFPHILLPFNDPQHLHPKKEYRSDQPREYYQKIKLLNCLTLAGSGALGGILGFSIDDIPTTLPDRIWLNGIQQFALYIGMTPHDYENLISWRVKPLDKVENDIFYSLIRAVADKAFQTEKTEQELSNITWNIHRTAIEHMSVGAMKQVLSGGNKTLHLTKVAERGNWQMTEIKYFLLWCIKGASIILKYRPVKIQSGQYDEAPRREKTQGEMVDEMTRELSNLPRFTMYAKIIDEERGKQVIKKRKMETVELPPLYTLENPEFKSKPPIEEVVLENGHTVCLTRTQIDEEIRKRQIKWRETNESKPPSAEGPPRRKRG